LCIFLKCGCVGHDQCKDDEWRHNCITNEPDRVSGNGDCVNIQNAKQGK
jgi:hypothetical protein